MLLPFLSRNIVDGIDIALDDDISMIGIQLAQRQFLSADQHPSKGRFQQELAGIKAVDLFDPAELQRLAVLEQHIVIGTGLKAQRIDRILHTSPPLIPIYTRTSGTYAGFLFVFNKNGKRQKTLSFL